VNAPKLWTVLTRAHRALRALAERSIADAGLCLSDFMVLEALLHKGPLTITAIQEKVLLASGSMTAAVDRVEKKGLVIRTFTPEDRRARVLQLTPEGRSVAQAAYRRHAKDLGSHTAVLTPAEQEQLYAVLKKIGLHAAEQKEKQQ
jgi:MarR family transcriptional regulator, 2-MHQ and catechol-resistance regulon repressor